MTINHRAEAERHLSQGSFVDSPDSAHPTDPVATDYHLRMAQVHATLARDEEQAARAADMRDALHSLRRRFNDTRDLVSAHIAKGLASRDKQRWQAARALAQGLDEAHNNMDDLIDAQLSECGWDTKRPWTYPATPADRDDPWSPAPDITADVPERVRRVLVEYLAAALLSKGDAQGVAQTITFALKHAGADLTGDIEKQISDIALGRDPSDPPF